MLHTLSCSPWQCDINGIVRMIRNDDDLLLIQDGVLGAIENSRFFKVINNATKNIFALETDINARGIINQISDRVSLVNFAYFVSLVIKHTHQMSW